MGRKRRTREEMLAHYQAQVEKLQAKIEGSYQDDSDSAILKQLRRRLRKTNTEYRAAQTTINGVAREDGKGWTRSPISDKIAKTQSRLESQLETQARAEVFAAKLPFDIERLEALVAAAEAGEDVEFPTDLTPLSRDDGRTDEEHEAMSIAKDDVQEVEV